MQYTDTQLKQALVKLLPTEIKGEHAIPNGYHLYYATQSQYYKRAVSDSELLHLCWLVEGTLNSSDHWHYFRQMENEIQMWLIEQDEKVEYGNIYSWAIHATWQQRTIALAKMKGIEIV